MALAGAVPRSSASQTAVLFDIDGTLVDSNYLHIDAWDRAFASAGHPVETWRIHRAIGMDSSKLIERLLEPADGADMGSVSEVVKNAHGRFYAAMADRLRAFAGARELLGELAARGRTVVLAKSAPQHELDTLLDVLKVGDSVDVVTSGADVESAKPDPDLVEVALTRASVSAEQAVMVGDSVWDVIAASRAGVRTIGVQSGGYSADELLSAGAVAVYDDIADLLTRLDDSPIGSDA
jgi:HAD superfamily hydrolase (TIGR01509 family)